jgi:bifunctional UDP-N-acetylglucosamine pyrophosphorylase / glucosamine-1-phosphate N-acetyltransferase
MKCESVILAAGLGTRMRSRQAKVMHPLGGRPLLQWTLEACRQAAGRTPFVVVGPRAADVRAALEGQAHVVEQAERLGTGHALLQAAPALQGGAPLVLVVGADMPLLRPETLRRLIERQAQSGARLTLLSARSDVSRGFGRVLRDADGRVREVIEEAHATAEQLGVRELNTSVYCFQGDWLWQALPALPLSPKGEYYLTDLVARAAAEGGADSLVVDDPDEIIGVNTREHLAEAEAALRRRINRGWMLAGVTLLDPATAYIGPEVQLAPDTVILPNTMLDGRTVVGEGCRLGPDTRIVDSTLGRDCVVQASVVEGATLGDGVDVGPFSHLRAGAQLMQGVHIGNFAEVKNSVLGPGVKMGHFSYVGDAAVGEQANIGAGAITCNFNREGRKSRTEIGAGAFIGSDSLLVAPVRVGEQAATGAGAVVTRDVPDHGLAVGMPARVIRKLKDDG